MERCAGCWEGHGAGSLSLCVFWGRTQPLKHSQLVAEQHGREDRVTDHSHPAKGAGSREGLVVQGPVVRDVLPSQGTLGRDLRLGGTLAAA